MKVSSIIQDSLGQVWVGTRNGLNKITATDITNYSTDDGLPSNRILDLICLSEEEIIILTSKGLSFYDGRSFKNYPFDFNEVDYRITAHPQHGLIILSFSSITTFLHEEYFQILDEFNIHNYSLNENGTLISQTEVSKKISVNLNDRTISVSSFDNDHTPYYLSKGLYRMKCQNTSCSNIDIYDAITNDLLLKVVNDQIIENNSHSKFLFTEETLIPLTHITKFQPLNTAVIRPKIALVDNEDNLWIGGENGVEVLRPSPFTTIASTRDKNIWSVNRLSSDELVMASFGKGLFSYDKKGLQQIDTRRQYFPTTAKDSNGNILLPGVNHLTRIGDRHEEISSKSSFAVAYDNARKLILTSNYGKIYMHNGKSIIDSITIEEGLHPHFYIQDIAIDSNGLYWLSSYGGISVFDPQDQSILNYTEENGNLPAGPGVFSSYVDQKGHIWLGGETGLMIVKDVSLSHIDEDALNIQIKGITRLDDHHLLLATPRELIVFNKTKYINNDVVELTFINDQMGYQGVEPGFAPFYNDTSGHIYICSSSSVDILNPNILDLSTPSSRTIIHAIDNRPIQFVHRDSTFEISDQDNVNIAVSNIGIGLPKKLHYRYQLDDEEWSAWQEDPTFTIQNLDHGKHRLEVWSSSNSAPKLSTSDVVFLKISLPYYKRKNFPYILSLTLTVLTAILLYQLISNYIRQRKYKQQISESRYLRSQLLLSQMSPHFIFNVLASIQNKILFNSKESANEQLVQLSQLMRNYLDVSYRGNSPNQYNEFEITLTKEIELLRSYLSFEQSNSNQHFEYDIIVAPEIAPELEILPPMLLQPYVENAVKHGVLPKEADGKIQIDFSIDKEQLKCIIKDNGPGFLQEKISDGLLKSSPSYGMKITKERVDLLNKLGYNIDIDIQSTYGEGTKVTVIIDS